MGNLTVFEVGKELPIGDFHGINGGVFILDRQAFLIIGFENMTGEECKLINESKGRIGLFSYASVIFVTYKFGSMYGDCAYNPNIDKQRDTNISEPEEGTGIPLHIIAVESTTNIIKSIRTVGTGTRWTQQLRKFVNEQKQHDFNNEKFFALVAELQQKWTSKELFRMSTTYRIGSEDWENSDKIT